MAHGDRSHVTNEKGEVIAIDIDDGNGHTERWDNYYPGSTSAREKISIQDHDDGIHRDPHTGKPV